MEVQIYWGVNPVTPISLLAVISFAGGFCFSEVILHSVAYSVVLSVTTFCSLADVYQHSA
jgi:hypothetical protein